MKFQAIRAHYRTELPKMMDEYRGTGCMQFDPYQLDFTGDMTPIESSVWIDIRMTSIPMYPQFPALNYFLDFANPFIKVAIECDGKQWHDAEKDARRDARLIADGWTIYRITGSECNRVREHPIDLECRLREKWCAEDEIAEKVSQHARDWFLTTSEGIVKAIAVVHFGAETKFPDFAHQSADMHRSATK